MPYLNCVEGLFQAAPGSVLTVSGCLSLQFATLFLPETDNYCT